MAAQSPSGRGGKGSGRGAANFPVKGVTRAGHRPQFRGFVQFSPPPIYITRTPLYATVLPQVIVQTDPYINVTIMASATPVVAAPFKPVETAFIRQPAPSIPDQPQNLLPLQATPPAARPFIPDTSAVVVRFAPYIDAQVPQAITTRLTRPFKAPETVLVDRPLPRPSEPSSTRLPQIFAKPFVPVVDAPTVAMRPVQVEAAVNLLPLQTPAVVAVPFIPPETAAIIRQAVITVDQGQNRLPLTTPVAAQPFIPLETAAIVRFQPVQSDLVPNRTPMTLAKPIAGGSPDAPVTVLGQPVTTDQPANRLPLTGQRPFVPSDLGAALVSGLALGQVEVQNSLPLLSTPTATPFGSGDTAAARTVLNAIVQSEIQINFLPLFTNIPTPGVMPFQGDWTAAYVLPQTLHQPDTFNNMLVLTGGGPPPPVVAKDHLRAKHFIRVSIG